MKLTKPEVRLVTSLFFLVLSEQEIGEAVMNDDRAMQLSNELDCVDREIETEAERRKIAIAAFGKLIDYMLTEEAQT